MTEETVSARRPSFREIVHAFETMDPEVLAAQMPKSPDTATIVDHYPELAAVAVRDITIPGPHGDVPARLYRRPASVADAALVWVHGGGFIAGDLDMPESHWVGLALAAVGLPVLAVDYRKCLHGVHYPIPSDDVLAAWRWALQHASDLGTTAERLHLGGASAGGALVAGVTKRLRDGAGPMPASVVLVYPLVHAELPPLSEELAAATAGLTENAFPPKVVRELNEWFAGTEAALADPYVFAGTGDVSGQPPVYVLNSEADHLRASGEAYAAQLEAAGGRVRVELEPGSQHGHLNAPFEPVGERSMGRIIEWLREGSR